MSELKQCPWCPGFTLRNIETRISAQPGLFECWMRCLDCGACGPVQVDDDLTVCQSEARKEYNNRAQPAATGGRVVKLPAIHKQWMHHEDKERTELVRLSDVIAMLKTAGIEVGQ